MNTSDGTVLQNYETFTYANFDFTQEKIHWITVRWILVWFPWTVYWNIYIHCVLIISISHNMLTWWWNFPVCSHKNKISLWTWCNQCPSLSFQIFSNIQKRKNTTIPHINTRETVTWLLLYFLKYYYNITSTFTNLKKNLVLMVHQPIIYDKLPSKPIKSIQLHCGHPLVATHSGTAQGCRILDFVHLLLPCMTKLLFQWSAENSVQIRHGIMLKPHAGTISWLMVGKLTKPSKQFWAHNNLHNQARGSHSLDLKHSWEDYSR